MRQYLLHFYFSIHIFLYYAYNETTPEIPGDFYQKGEDLTVQKSDNEPYSCVLPFRSHTALLLATALPFLQPMLRHPVELITKILEFSETLKLYQEFHSRDSSLLSCLFREGTSGKEEPGLLGIVNRFTSDPEGLLHGLSRICTGKEKEIINLLLSLLRAKSFYETYGDILNGFMSTTGFTDAAESNSQPAKEEEFSMPDMASVLAGGGLTSMLNEEQTDTLNLLKSLLDAE